MRPEWSEQSLPLQILLSPSAERPFQALAPLVREQLTRIIEGIARLAAVAPPIDPLWLKLAKHGAPLMRFQHAGVEVFYELDVGAKTLRITSLRHGGSVDCAGAY